MSDYRICRVVDRKLNTLFEHASAVYGIRYFQKYWQPTSMLVQKHIQSSIGKKNVGKRKSPEKKKMDHVIQLSG